MCDFMLKPGTVRADEGAFLSAATRERILAITDELAAYQCSESQVREMGVIAQGLIQSESYKDYCQIKFSIARQLIGSVCAEPSHPFVL